MHRPALLLHGFMSIMLVGLFIGLWGAEIFAGDGPWLSWRRDFSFLGIYADMYAMVLINIVLVPAMIITSLHTASLLGYARQREGVRAMSTLVIGLSIAVLATVAVRFKLWRAVVGGGAPSALPAPPSDEKLEYPELPLAAKVETPFTLAPTGGGAEISLDSLKGKVVFLNFWATWCGFCIAEFPNIQRLYDAVKDNPKIAVVLVTKEEPGKVKAWLEGKGKEYQLPFYITTEIPERYEPDGWPTTYIIAPNGEVAFKHSGFVAWDGQKTRDFLNNLAGL